MARKAPRRHRHRKGRKHHRRARGGKMKDNTKVDERVVYRVTQKFTTVNSTNGVGFYTYNAYSTQNSNYYNILQSSEFAAQSKLFDEFCITSMRLDYRPYYNVIYPTQAGAFDINLYTIIDRDGNTPVSKSVDVPSKLQAYDSCKIYKLTKQWHRTMRCKKFWTDCNSPVLQASSLAGVAQPWVNSGTQQVLLCYAENVPVPAAGAVLAEITVSYHVQFRGKKPVSFTYEPTSGSVIMTPIESYVPLPVNNPPASVATVLEGDETMACEDGLIVIRSNKDDAVATAA